MTTTTLAEATLTNLPQWSPSRSDGVTPRCHARPPDRTQAAMEPVQIGRGDHMIEVKLAGDIFAAMEPVQIGRGDVPSR